MKFIKENRKAPDRTPRFAALHLGSFCLPMSHKKDARLVWVNSFPVCPVYSVHGKVAEKRCLAEGMKIGNIYCKWGTEPNSRVKRGLTTE